MQFTPEILHRHAQVLVDKEVKNNRDIMAAYLKGSLLYGSPLVGGAGDIDLVFIYTDEPQKKREIRKLTPEICFDIEHHDQLPYRNPRELRLDPWFGPTLRDAVPLYDPRHLLDYTQSGVRSNFTFPENVQARSLNLLEGARQFWLDRQINPPQEIVVELPLFLKALENALNSVASLSGPPLPLRRLGKDFPLRAEQTNAPGLAIAFNHLLGTVGLNKEKLTPWLAGLTQAFQAYKEDCEPGTILAEQEAYYLNALEVFIQNENPTVVLWPLLNIWTEIIAQLPDQSQLQIAWIKALTNLGFAGSDYQVRLAALDSFLDLCESLISKETLSVP